MLSQVTPEADGQLPLPLCAGDPLAEVSEFLTHSWPEVTGRSDVCGGEQGCEKTGSVCLDTPTPPLFEPF